MIWQDVGILFYKNLDLQMILFWHSFQQFFLNITWFSFHKCLKILRGYAANCIGALFLCATIISFAAITIACAHTWDL